MIIAHSYPEESSRITARNVFELHCYGYTDIDHKLIEINPWAVSIAQFCSHANLHVSGLRLHTIVVLKVLLWLFSRSLLLLKILLGMVHTTTSNKRSVHTYFAQVLPAGRPVTRLTI